MRYLSALLLLGIITVASAFQGSRCSSARSAHRLGLDMKIDLRLPEELPGAVGPTGFFDPLNLSKDVAPRELKRWHEAELKHGRVAMIAVIGFFVQESFHPLFNGAITGPAVTQFQAVQERVPLFWLANLFAIAITEAVTIGRGWQSPDEYEPGQTRALLKDDWIPGDLGFDPLGLLPPGSSNFNKMSPEFYDIRTKELQNGRLAMLGIAGIVAQELVDKRPILEHFAKFGLGAAGPAI